MKTLKITPVIFMVQALLLIAFIAKSQKLPNVQQGSVRAPADIKIDGKTTEWNNKLLAYNNATNIFYTLSNDDNNLYLTVRATDFEIIKKIIKGGITLTLNPSGKKNEKNGPSITFPVFGRSDVVINFKSMPEIVPGSAVAAKQLDDFVNENNNLLGKKSKYVMVTGIRGMDTLTSVYNEDGIKTAQLFDNKMAYTYELAVNLKKIGLSANSPEKFLYNIKLNGINPYILYNSVINKEFNEGRAAGLAAAAKRSADGGSGQTTGAAPEVGAMNSNTMRFNGDQSQNAPTDFWGEYILAKK